VQKLLGIAAIVGLIWLGMSVYAEGTDAVFGPWLELLGFERPEEPDIAPLERFREKGQAAADAMVDRVEKQLPPETAGTED
jgi:hypothetical protein